jgi:predicted metal-dependent phosphotriesterase family hydrolase
MNKLNLKTDANRMRQLKLFIDEGYGKKITISHDIHTRHRFVIKDYILLVLIFTNFLN